MKEDRKTAVIAFAGKGGVGKTSISALSVRLLSERYPDKRILAIDADPAVGLATALGMEVDITVDDIRNGFIRTVEDGEAGAAVEMLGEARYRLTDALSERENISFLAIGRPEAAGCYCSVNAYLKEVIGLIAGNFDFVIIDGEAGIEQINRRVMEHVTHLVLVSDASRKGIQVAKEIKAVASQLTMAEKTGLIINRIPDVSLCEGLETGDLDMVACIGDDRGMTMSDIKGDTVFSLDDCSPILMGVEQALRKMEIIIEGK